MYIFSSDASTVLSQKDFVLEKILHEPHPRVVIDLIGGNVFFCWFNTQ